MTFEELGRNDLVNCGTSQPEVSFNKGKSRLSV